MMPTHASMMETSRHTKKTLYVVAAFYVVVGFVAATASALNGDRLGTFLGFLIISGALGTTALLRAVLRIGVRISAIGDAVKEMHARLGRLETGLNEVRSRSGLDGRTMGNAGGVRMLDLAAMGNGNPGALVAATLDHEAYPRLVKTMEEEPPAQSDEVAARGEEQSASSDQTQATTKNLLRQWAVALGDGDLAGCRGVYTALVDTAGEEAVASLGEQIEELADRVERSLREAFSSRVRAGDYAGGLAIGERICSLLPDRPVTAEFQRIRPYLLGRLSREASTSDQPLAASQ
jgi:hypothetical protein